LEEDILVVDEINAVVEELRNHAACWRVEGDTLRDVRKRSACTFCAALVPVERVDLQLMWVMGTMMSGVIPLWPVRFSESPREKVLLCVLARKFFKDRRLTSKHFSETILS
jgi:hypothetical protein